MSFSQGRPASYDRRRNFSQEIAALSGVRAEPILRALENVPREDFLPPGPWTIERLGGGYFQTPDDDPSHILHAVGVALSRSRGFPLHCANPALAAKALETTGLRPGDRVLHVGAGLGYFSAIMAELVGPSGQVFAAEIDPELAAQARLNLAPWPQVVVVGDALALAPHPYDVVFSSAGMATIPSVWLDSLAVGGRMTLPLTGSNETGFSFTLRKCQEHGEFAAKMESFVCFFPCIGLRDAEDIAALDSALASKQAPYVTSLRRDRHDLEPACWLHGEGWCLTTR